MKITNIHDSWGTIIEFNDPMEFFIHTQSYWRSLIYDRKLIIFKKMDFSLLDYMKFAYLFGNPWKKEDYRYSREKAIIIDHDQKEYVTSEFSNKIVSTKTISLMEMPWHADIPNRQFNPFPHRSLWIVKNPNPEISGKTKWLNIDLDTCKLFLTDKLINLIPRISLDQQSWYFQGTDIQRHNFLKIHPVTCKPSLRLNYYCDISKNITNAWIKDVYIDGIKQKDCSLIQEYIDCLCEHSKLLYYHQWDTFDIAIYDNYPFIHGRTELKLIIDDQVAERKFYRTNIDHIV